jgi:hypothetical protein
MHMTSLSLAGIIHAPRGIAAANRSGKALPDTNLAIIFRPKLPRPLHPTP